MILVDSSIWIDHFRSSNARLTTLLENGGVLSHAFVIGELALGSLRQRETIIGALRELPRAIVAEADEVLSFIEDRRLFGLGIGYVDAHLLAAVHLTAGSRLWSRDRRLDDAAKRLGVAA